MENEQDEQGGGRPRASGSLQPNRSMPESDIIPELGYPDVTEAVAWLQRVFGFVERLRIGNHRSQLAFGQGNVIAFRRSYEPQESGASTGSQSPAHAIMVRVNNIDQHHENAVNHGAEILNAPADYPYGERQYSVRDPGGHVWTFSQTIADVDPASWGGTVP